MHMVQLIPLNPKTPSSLVSFKSRLVLPFWYRLTQVVPEKTPLNGCSSILVVFFGKPEFLLSSSILPPLILEENV